MSLIRDFLFLILFILGLFYFASFIIYQAELNQYKKREYKIEYYYENKTIDTFQADSFQVKTNEIIFYIDQNKFIINKENIISINKN